MHEEQMPEEYDYHGDSNPTTNKGIIVDEMSDEQVSGTQHMLITSTAFLIIDYFDYSSDISVKLIKKIIGMNYSYRWTTEVTLYKSKWQHLGKFVVSMDPIFQQLKGTPYVTVEVIR